MAFSRIDIVPMAVFEQNKKNMLSYNVLKVKQIYAFKDRRVVVGTIIAQ
ncbi:hypothetical protein ACRPOS_006585 [Bartonella heixiaziensis]